MTMANVLINNKYALQREIGHGGMAYVYLAKDITLNRMVALKIIRKEAFPPKDYDHLYRRFEIEARTLARLDHPNIVKIYDYGMYGGSPFLVMEYIEGGTLKQQMGKPYPYNHAAFALAPIADGLAYAHNRNILHRDVKPANILIRKDGSPVLTDFGIAKMLEYSGGDATLTETGMGVGTPEYMSPEQCIAEKNIDGRADEYSLGMIFFEMCTGRKPYSGKTPTDIMLKQVNAEAPKLSDYLVKVPPRLSEVINKVLAKNRDDRYPSCKIFAEKLQELSRDKNVPIPVIKTQTANAPLGSDGKTVDEIIQNNPGERIIQSRPKKKPSPLLFLIPIILIIFAVAGMLYYRDPSIFGFLPINSNTNVNLTQTAQISGTEDNFKVTKNETSAPEGLFPTITNTVNSTALSVENLSVLETPAVSAVSEVAITELIPTITATPRPTATETPRPVTAERVDIYINNVTQFYVHNDSRRNDSFQNPVMVKEASVNNFPSRALAQRNGIEKNAALSLGDIVTYAGQVKYYGNDLMLLVRTSSNVTGYVYSGYLAVVETPLSDSNGNTTAVCDSDYVADPHNAADLHPGDLIRFGNYDKTPLLWQIVSIDENNNALLVSQYLITQLPYNSGQGFNTTWENCSLRGWLNNNFLNSAFKDEEQEKLLSYFSDSQEDKVTLLSKSDVSDGQITFGKEIFSPCWLKDGMLISTDRAYYFNNGLFDDTYHETVTVRLGIRPVIRINLQSL